MVLKRFKNIFFCVIILISSSCNKIDFPYQLDSPKKIIELPKKLNEISGLDYFSKDTLVGVQDEIATIFFLNSKDGQIYDKIVFGKKGDFEGIAKHKDKFFVLKSNGTLIRVSKKGKTKAYDFKKNKDFDFEGLCLDTLNNRLLIACKEHGKEKKKHSIYVYAFSLEDKEYLKEPVFKISKKVVGEDFLPSGIAIHPSGNIYIPSAYSHQLLQMTNSGKAQHIIDLNHSSFNQAEGICFGKRGELYIANEKGNGVPNIMIFEQKK